MPDEMNALAPQALTFQDDPGATRAFWIAGLLCVLIAGWFGSGLLKTPDPADTPAAPRDRAPIAVAVISSQAETVPEVFLAEGEAEPDRDSAILAETSGEIAEVLLDLGDNVTAGAVIARFDPTQRSAELRRAQAELTRIARELQNAETLFERGVATLDRVAAQRAAFAAAEAAVVAAEQAVSDTEIRAPFDGRLEELTIDPGEYVPAGTAVARVVDRDPLTVRARIPQQSLARIQAGQTAQIAFITGQEREGRVTFVGSAADPETRTFALDIEVENADGAIPAGVSAEIRIRTGEAKAHFVSPAILSLDEGGVLGLKTVDDENRVEFHPVEILRAETDGLWVGGLPEVADIITVGQGFVRAGDQVAPKPEGAAE